jgi:hypothetical protein
MLWTHVVEFLITAVCVVIALFSINRIEQNGSISHKGIVWLKTILISLIPINAGYILLHVWLGW